ncbi:hypothetical protein EB796_016644 [Bugula neritina]|uniref:Uncharacterized protein n=1 Tax=Bugula neritina TaxID=10212 RepID=A0A7J7JG66_BUGNE|nr:hypothetical protein EB796_016644 [Bugula neritina]
MHTTSVTTSPQQHNKGNNSHSANTTWHSTTQQTNVTTLSSIKENPESKYKPDIKEQPGKDFTKDYTKECDHFTDWPTPFKKLGCPKSHSMRDNSLAIVIYLKDDLESLPTQTFLSALQFCRESNVSIANIVFVYRNDGQSVHSVESHIEYFMELTAGSIPIISKSAATEWKAKQAGVDLANARQVLVIDDTYIVNRNFIAPLISTVESHPQTLVVPHIDSLLPVRIYSQYGDKKLHPDSQIWQEGAISRYRVLRNMTMSRVAARRINTQPVLVKSGGVNGEVMMAARDWLLLLLSKMQTDDVAELSLLSYMCGDGVVVNKCSAVVRSNNYNIFVPVTKDPQKLKTLYSPDGKSSHKDLMSSCKDVSYYLTM